MTAKKMIPPVRDFDVISTGTKGSMDDKQQIDLLNRNLEQLHIWENLMKLKAEESTVTNIQVLLDGYNITLANYVNQIRGLREGFFLLYDEGRIDEDYYYLLDCECNKVIRSYV